MKHAKERDLLEGDRNTKYFMLKASGRKRRGKIFRLCQDGEFIEGDDNILKFATSFYKELFGPVRLMPVTL